MLADLDSAPAEPGQLGGAQFNGRQGPVDPEHLLPALVQRAGQGHGRLVGHRQQERRVGRERRRPHPGTDHGAGFVADHQPPVAVGLRDPLGHLRRDPVRDRGHDRADYRVGGQVVTRGGEELARIGEELQAQDLTLTLGPSAQGSRHAGAPARRITAARDVPPTRASSRVPR